MPCIPAPLRNLLVAADTARPRVVSMAAWLAALRDAGFTALAIDIDDDAPPASARIAFVRLTLDLAADRLPKSAPTAIAVASRHGATIELTITSSSAHDRPSAARGLPRAAAHVAQLATQAQAAGVSITLRPRRGTWMQRLDDAARVAMRVNRANLGLTLSLPDWLAADGGAIDTRLKLAMPRLMNVIVGETPADGQGPGAGSGVRVPGSGSAAEPGTWHPGVLQRVWRAGYDGPITVELAGRDDATVDQLIAALRRLEEA